MLEIPASRRAFHERIMDVGVRLYHDKHPFHRRMNEGGLTRAQLACWAENRFAYQRIIPRKDGAILSNMPDGDLRRRWFQRILDQDGAPLGDGADSGLEAWLQLIDACGGSRARALSGEAILPGVAFACEAYLNFCRQQPWQEAVAASLTELFAPKLHAIRVDAFPKYYPWVDEAGLRYFRNRIKQANADVTQGLSIVLDQFTTPAQEDRVVQIVEFKCHVLWTILDVVQLTCFPNGM